MRPREHGMGILEYLGFGGEKSDRPVSDDGMPETVRKLVDELNHLEPERARFVAAFAYILSRAARADLHICEKETRTMERIVAHREQEIPPLLSTRDDIAPEVDRIYQHMVAKKPKDRYQTMSEVIQDMEKCRNEFGHMWMIRRFIAEQKLPTSMGDVD